MVILGLNAYHADSAACLIVDGRLVAAAEEERFRRIKHWAGLPTKAIDYCLSEARLNLSQVEHIAINRKPGVNNWRRLGFVVTHWPSPQLLMQKIKNIRSAVSAKETLEKTYRMELKAEVHQVEHHLAHLASAFLVSDFEEAACLSVDGFGDFASTAFGFGLGHKITIDQRIYFPHSLGIFYSALTQYLGFPHYGDEYKVMGLAPYGEPKMIEPLREVVSIQTDGTFRLNLDYFRHHSDNVSYTWEDCTPSVGLLYKSALVDLLGPARAPNEPLEQKHKDLARSIQVTYEKAFFSLLHTLHRQHPCNNLALAGGCAMNSVANGKIYRRTPFTQMYIPAAAGDAGGAIGAAAVVLAELDDSAVFAPAERRRPAEMRPSGATVSPVRAAITDEEPVVVQEEEDDPFAPWETREKLKTERLKAEKGNEEQANGGTGEAGLELVERVVSGSKQGGGDALNPKENRGRRLAGFQSRKHSGSSIGSLSTPKAFGGPMRSTEGELKTETLRAETLKVAVTDAE
ncbi:MAG TPA: carbamoyltransferase N-terminal domain-containing protein, partial [Chthoniobacterales bacterium]